MNLTSLILFKTMLFYFQSITNLMDQILVSDKIENIVLYYQHHSIDVLNAILSSKYASKRTFFVLEYSENYFELRRRTENTFYIYLVDLWVLQSLSARDDYLGFNWMCRHLFVINEEQVSRNCFHLKLWTKCNMAVMLWKKQLLLLTFNYNLQVFFTLFDTSRLQYDDMFLDNFFAQKPLSLTLYLVPVWSPPHEMALTTANNTDTYFFGTNFYLAELVCQHFGIILQTFAYSNLYEAESYKDYMKGHVVDLKPNQKFRTIIYKKIMTTFRHIWPMAESYPFNEDKLVIIVPNKMVATSLLIKLILESPLLVVWSITIIVMTILRLAFLQKNGKNRANHTGRIILDTYSIAFTGAGFVTIKKRPERILMFSLSIFSILSSIFCTSLIFQQYTSDLMHPVINSIEELNKSDLEIHGSVFTISPALIKFLEEM